MNVENIDTSIAPVITFVATGPGSAEYLTQESIKALTAAKKIYCFGTQIGERYTSRTLDTLRQLDSNMAEKAVVLTLPMSAQRQAAHEAYERLTQQLCANHAEGLHVAICVEGSANIYASVRYVMQRLTDLDIPYTETAGIPSFIAAAAMAHLSLCEQQERLMVIPGTITSDEIEAFISHNTNLVVMKLSQCTPAIHECISRHPDYQYHYFENVGTREQFYTTDIHHLRSLTQFPYFSLLIIKPRSEKADSSESTNFLTR